MSFRFNVDLSFDFPRPPPRGSSTQAQIVSSSPDRDSPQAVKPGFRGWIQTARQHPRYSLRLLYFIACIIGLILNAIVVNSIWSYRIVDVATGAFYFLSAGLVWQLVTLYDFRLFRGRQIPNWVVAVIETAGFGVFAALVVLVNIAVEDQERYGYSPLEAVNLMKVAYNSSVWVLCCLLNGILAIQCYAKGVRNVRAKRPKCPDCEHAQEHGANDDGAPAEGDEEQEALLGGDQSEAGPSKQGATAAYRDEPEGEGAA
ncbi:MAG: hypothetical protein HETSPECPRED_009299 [Heterodermia speciosa]|uniref:Uncharacterized protein n=1 Tax=Heterodermia speciosa TaxID=116794 RepID=A0A8H3IVU0_9LECA|nr:MAG: hypothetical protein HETSPECPRED_009299 [Heterodermia speciosa]